MVSVRDYVIVGLAFGESRNSNRRSLCRAVVSDGGVRFYKGNTIGKGFVIDGNRKRVRNCPSVILVVGREFYLVVASGSNGAYFCAAVSQHKRPSTSERISRIFVVCQESSRLSPYATATGVFCVEYIEGRGGRLNSYILRYSRIIVRYLELSSSASVSFGNISNTPFCRVAVVIFCFLRQCATVGGHCISRGLSVFYSANLRYQKISNGDAVIRYRNCDFICSIVGLSYLQTNLRERNNDISNLVGSYTVFKLELYRRVVIKHTTIIIRRYELHIIGQVNIVLFDSPIGGVVLIFRRAFGYGNSLLRRCAVATCPAQECVAFLFRVDQGDCVILHGVSSRVRVGYFFFRFVEPLAVIDGVSDGVRLRRQATGKRDSLRNIVCEYFRQLLGEVPLGIVVIIPAIEIVSLVRQIQIGNIVVVAKRLHRVGNFTVVADKVYGNVFAFIDCYLDRLGWSIISIYFLIADIVLTRSKTCQCCSRNATIRYSLRSSCCIDYAVFHGDFYARDSAVLLAADSLVCGCQGDSAIINREIKCAFGGYFAAILKDYFERIIARILFLEL